METQIIVLFLVQIIVNGEPVRDRYAPTYYADASDSPYGYKKLSDGRNDLLLNNNNEKPDNGNSGIAYEYYDDQWRISPNKDFDFDLDLKLRGLKVSVPEPLVNPAVWRKVQGKIYERKRQRPKFTKKNPPKSKHIAYQYYDDGWLRKDSSLEFTDGTEDYIDDSVHTVIPTYKKNSKENKRNWWIEGSSTPYVVRKYDKGNQFGREGSKQIDFGFEIYCQDGFCKVAKDEK